MQGFEKVTEGGFFGDRLGPCSNHPAPNGHVLSPRRYQLPTHVPSAPRIAAHDGQDILRRSYVVGRSVSEPLAVELEPVLQLVDGQYEPVVLLPVLRRCEADMACSVGPVPSYGVAFIPSS